MSGCANFHRKQHWEVVLNFGIDKANFKFVAKWDDDDYYGPAYLDEALKTFENTNADNLGKRTIFMYFPKTKKLRLLFRGREFKFVKRVLGGTLIAKKTVMQEVPFLNISLHEDSNFIKNARAKGYRIYRQAKIIMYTSDEIQISTHECLQKGI